MAVSVLIPWRASSTERQDALDWLVERLAVRWPDWQIVLGHHEEGEWCKAAAVADALERAEGDLLVVHDADVWCDRTADSVGAVELGAPWAMPHRQVRRLTNEATRQVLDGGSFDAALKLEQKAYDGYAGGGIVVLTRSTYEKVPLDRRYTNWGQEDSSWALALHCLAGDVVRLDGTLWHLWHPHQDRLSRVKGNDKSWLLFRRYHAARRDPEAMRALLEEVSDAVT